MTTLPDIALTLRTSGWVQIINRSKANYPATIRFLEHCRPHLSLVCFGDNPGGSHALKSDRITAFQAYAAKHGLTADFAA